MIFGATIAGGGGRASASAVVVAALVALSFDVDRVFVRGHGYMYTPRSRNWYAYEEGTDDATSAAPGVPMREYCAHCLNSNNGVCGASSNYDYDNYLDAGGSAMPWISQNTFAEGGIITVKSFLHTHHAGHMTLSLCPDGPTSAQACFDAPENKLMFVNDPLYGMPQDPNYPERGYYAGGESGGIQDFEMLFKLPDGISGDQVLLQWKYITANACSPPGYKDYFDAHSELESYWKRSLPGCVPPYPQDGSRSTTDPEQFWNCAEVTIIPGNPQSTTSTSSTASPPDGSTTTTSSAANPPVSSTTSTTTSSSSTATATPGAACCTRDYKNCNYIKEDGSTDFCDMSKVNCEGPCDKTWLDDGAKEGCMARWEMGCSNNGDCCDPLYCNSNSQCELEANTTTPTTTTTTTSSAVSPPESSTTTTTTSSSPMAPGDLFSCSPGKGISSFDALDALDGITNLVSSSPYTLSVIASGGAAGSGDVVSESQAYGVLAAGLALVSLNEGDDNYDSTKNKFQGYFNGWKQMCENSLPVSSCQSTKYCNNGQTPCLPGWKHNGDLSSVLGTGSAPDGDEDAIVGMIIALKAVENDSTKPSWFDEVHDWADRSCTQFLQDNTLLSSSSSHRLLKLGSCWGGWDGNGNNPSYHAPGHYRMMRDFQASVESRSYSLPSYLNTDNWNMLIDTSYKFLSTTQCAETGLVPNWALVEETDANTLAKYPGSFSGSGTPQYEFGSEASRTMWRIAFDAAAYPEESAAQSLPFLAPLHEKLVLNFDPSPSNAWEYFKEASLRDCSADEGYVSSVFGSWQWNQFISAPVYSSLVAGISDGLFVGKGFDQQAMVDAACEKVKETANLSYYPLSWQVIVQMTLNGEVAKLAEPAAPMTSVPTAGPTSAPTKAPADPCWSNNYKDCNLQNNSCAAIWLPTGPQDACVALWGDCTGQSNSCCAPAVCHGDASFPQQCVPQAKSDAVTSNTRALSDCITCDDVPTSWMNSNGLECATADWIGTQCSEDSNWIRNRFCRKTCFDIGHGYDGDVCCKEVMLQNSLLK